MRIRPNFPGAIRPIESRDEASIDAVIRAARQEFGVTGPGFDSHEPATVVLYDLYQASRSRYFVVDVDGRIGGGAGIAPYGAPDSDTCELQRMYLAPGARGAGHGKALLYACLLAAQKFGYRRCYLETAASLAAARQLYELAGFTSLAEPLDHAVHPACDAFYLLELAPTAQGSSS